MLYIRCISFICVIVRNLFVYHIVIDSISVPDRGMSVVMA